MNDQIEKIVLTYAKDAEGREIPGKMYALMKDGTVIDGDYDSDKYYDGINEFLQSRGYTGIDDPKAINDGALGIFSDEEFNDEKRGEFLGIANVSPTASTSEPVVSESVAPESDDVPFDEQYANYDGGKKVSGKTVAKVAVAGVALAGIAFGTTALLKGCSAKEEEIQKEKDEIDADDLLKNLTEEQKAFFAPTFDAVAEFNTRTTEKGNFKLDADKSELHITLDEAIALNVIFNNYSGDELYEIFGTTELDATSLMNNARSAYSKLSVYYMNATKASGLSALINDEAARAFFEKHENAVLAFNGNPTTELSDEVIKGMYYDYLYGGSTGEYAKINNDGVAWLATSAGFGFELANRNVEEFLRINNVSEEEIAKYQEAAASVGMSLNQITTSELLNGINEEIPVDVMDDINNKSLCAAVTGQTRDKVTALTMKQQIATTIIATNAKTTLVEGLRGVDSTLANKVLASDTNISEDLLDEIRALGKDGNELVDTYDATMSSLSDKEAKLLAVMEIAKEKYNSKVETDIAELVNNRFRTKEIEKVEDTKNDIIAGYDEAGKPVLDGEKFNELPADKKDEVIKEEGEVIGTTTTTTETPVDKEDLTESEKVQVESQEAILKEIENTQNDLIEKGGLDAHAYTEEKGTYNYNGKVVDPNTGYEYNMDNLSLFNIAAHVSAFTDNVITSDDQQIQSRMNNDALKVASKVDSLSNEAKQYLQSQYGSNWREQFINDSYKATYISTIDQILDSAVKQGEVLKASAEEAYKKSQAENEIKNQDTGSIVTPDDTTNVVPDDKPVTPPEYDPNTDTNRVEEGEIEVVVPKDILNYVPDSEYSGINWDDYYGNNYESIGGNVKVK